MIRTIARTLLFMVTAALMLSAQPGPKMRSMHNDLKLTDAQQEQFEKISFDTQKKEIELKAKLETARLELRRLMDADQLDRSAIEKKMNEIADVQVSMKMNKLNGWADKNKALTPEQQKIWKEMMKMHLRAKGPRGMQHGMMMRGSGSDRMMMRHPMMMDKDDDDDTPMKMEHRIEKKIIKE